MPYLFRVLFGKEKKVIGLFAHEGIELVRIPVSEYLIGYDPRCAIVRYRETVEGYIVNMSEISEQEAYSLKTQATSTVNAETRISIGQMVTVTEGEYKGLNGFVRNIIDDTVTVDISLFGRMHPVRLAFDHLIALHVPEVWR